MKDAEFVIRLYKESDQQELLHFFTVCLPESGRFFEPERRHESLTHVSDSYDVFYCLVNATTGEILGTCALKKMNETACEFKCVYVLEKYHGMGYGKQLCQMVIKEAKRLAYQEMYLDTISRTSQKAIGLYHHLGFTETQQYHEAKYSDVFMKLDLSMK